MADLVTGIDIGSTSLKIVVLSLKGKNPKLITLGSSPLPGTGMNSDADIDLENISQVIKNLLVAIKAPNCPVVVALPESKIFTRVISDLPFLTDDELASAIKYSAEEFVPLPTDQVNLYWEVIERSKQNNRTMVFVVASPKNTVSRYMKVLNYAKLKPLALETELIASARALVGSNIYAPTTMIVQFGASSTDYAVVSKGVILLTRSIATGGLALTRAVAQYLDFEFPQAEQYKKVYGIMQDQLEGKIYQALKPLVDLMVVEAVRIIQAFQAKNKQNPIKRVVLSGAGAKLPGIVVYFANSLGLEVQEADPWFSLDKDQNMIKKFQADAPSFSVAVGLALRGE